MTTYRESDFYTLNDLDALEAAAYEALVKAYNVREGATRLAAREGRIRAVQCPSRSGSGCGTSRAGCS